ncbi:ATP-dependent nuclease [Rhizobium sophoriradicis]|uniref:OLD family endonuclease n=1 Tax=Rhizobium sophoriradicis TaxID=1535245 RepID=A0A2A5KKZ1_9HYPH|nr:ATP-binding protein [Rhizobium sophoriradicis]PCK77665.1 OLD family endonuclease [Rhizobium sophoriradicis]
MIKQPRIRRIKISNFRGLASTDWIPDDRMNLLIGGGDSGKSTLLHAIALVFSPTNSAQVFETDYFNRSLDHGFEIEATVSLPPEVELANFQQTRRPWEWNGNSAILPDRERDDANSDPVYVFRVRGTADLELVWEVVQPNMEVVGLSTSLRRKVGVVRLANDDRNDRDLRLVTGSALDRLLSKGNLKSRISAQVGSVEVSNAFTGDETKALKNLDKILKKAGLPHNLDIGLTSSQGLSIGALVGLLAEKDGTLLPVASWGAGTRRMAALQVAGAIEAATRLTVIDEIERGLEPYRLRQLLDALGSDHQQCFLTTHSPIVIAAAKDAALWYMDGGGQIGRLHPDKVGRQQSRDPETFLSKVPIIAEGVTEVGFLRALFRTVFREREYVHGIRISDGGGNESMLGLLEALRSAGINGAGFCDDEGRFPERWRKLKDASGPKLFQWPAGCLEENVIAHVPDDKLFSLAYDPDGSGGDRLRTLADRLSLPGKEEAEIRDAAGSIATLRALIIAAATGDKRGAPDDRLAKEWSKHSQRWFKSIGGGVELCEKMIALGLWSKIEPDLLPFINAIRSAVGMSALAPGELRFDG